MPASLVTGGAGFLGSHLCRVLADRGHDVVVVDDLSGGFRENIDPRVAFVEGSITDVELIERLFAERGFDYVYHLAAYAAEGLSHFIRRFNYTNNLIGSVNLINASVKHEVKRFVFTSSIAVYGSGKPPLREIDPLHPEDPYGVAKLAVEQDLAAAYELFGLEYAILRPHNVYGEYQNLGDRYRNVVGIFMNNIMSGKPLTIFGDGEQTRAFSYVGDILDALASAATHDGARNEVFNVGGEEVLSVNALARAVLKVTGADVGIVHEPPRVEVQHAFADHGKSHETFGKPVATTLHDGLAKMWAWAQERGVQSTSRFDDIEVRKNLPPSWET